jgi:predicted ATP-grasp superfamily ATP-dependent carboligase
VPGNADQLASLDVQFPVVLKPAITSRFCDATNRKAYRADNRQELQNLYEDMLRVIPPSEVIVQEFLPEPSRNLFSFAGYYRQGELIVGLSVKRIRQFPRDFGRISTFVVAVEVPELRELASQLLRAIQYTGLAEVEFMWDPKHTRFELLEVNARLWAWHGLAIAAGLDLPYVAFADALGQNPPIGAMRQGVKWVRLLTDVRAAAQEILTGTTTVQQYLTSLRGTTAFAVFSPSDPIPFIAEPFLMLLNRLNRWAVKRRRSLPFHRFAFYRENGIDSVRKQGENLKAIKTDIDDEGQHI